MPSEYGDGFRAENHRFAEGGDGQRALWLWPDWSEHRKCWRCLSIGSHRKMGAPFRRVIDRPVDAVRSSRSPSGRACHPLIS